jgi:hypothetical protein
MEIIENGLSVSERPPDVRGNDAEAVVLNLVQPLGTLQHAE